MAGYTIQAKKGEYNGIVYDSQLEIRFAKLLDKTGVKFIPHCWCLVKIEGEERQRQIDFFCYPRPIKPHFCDQFYFGFELKGTIQYSDYTRRKALQEIGIPTFIVLPQMLEFWESGYFLKHELGSIKRERKKTEENGNILD